MRRSLLLLAAVLALLWPVRMAQGQDPGAVDTLLSLINGARAASGLPPYTLNPRLAAAAQSHSADMAARAADILARGGSIGEAITHTGSDGSRPADRVAATGYDAIQVGENIFTTTRGPQAAFEWWMGSGDHRHNILHDRYLEIGIGVAPGPEGSVMYTLVFAHSEDSPVLPAPTLPPTQVPPTAAPGATTPPTETTPPSLTPTPDPTATTAHVRLPPAASETPTPTPPAGARAGAFARDRLPWVILLEAGAAAVAIYTLIRARARR